MQPEVHVIILAIQILMLIVDLTINAVAILFFHSNAIQLMLYAIQDTCLLMSLLLMFLNFFTTYVYQAGLISLLIARFRVSIIITFLYIAVTVAFHTYTLVGSLFYYYFYKRAAMLLTDPKYEGNSAWLMREIQKRFRTP
ncbi:unnamed protein product [Soboliphyme baturini]|uniref:Transmembrane protein 138 n=1 Tax=Soboliphyme baturini TaxID=241478 RepID=A0A183J1P2_9BILA|nr:unnamed protein product [Soboliphyme baturini]